MNRPGMESRTISKLSWFKEWALDSLGNIRHEERVAAIVSRLVKITSSLHNLNQNDLWFLRFAALVHDIGRCEEDRRHPSIGARMIRRNKDLPLKKRQRRALAFLTLRHRGAVPDIADDRSIRSGDDGAKLHLLLAFLRAADCLDSRSLPSPNLTFSRRGRRIRIVCQIREDCAKARAVFSRRKKFRLLEAMLDCRVEVAIVAQRRLRAVA